MYLYHKSHCHNCNYHTPLSADKMHTKYIAMKYLLAYKEGRSCYCINAVRSRGFFLQSVSLFVLIFRNSLKNIYIQILF